MIGLSDSAKAVVVPSQPKHLTEPVKLVLDSMHQTPETATEILHSWKKRNGAELCFKGATLRGLSLAQSNFSGFDLQQAVFDSCDLRGAIINSSTLDGTRFVAVEFDRENQFLRSKSMQNCSMERYALACLGPERGLLTEGNLMDMKIVDDVADLRLRFSGFLAWIHILSIAVFFFPYVWFLFIQWGRAKWSFPPEDCTIPLSSALGRYIWNGGRDWQSGRHLDFWSMTRFVAVLFYQFVRIALLAKTKSLEMKQVVTGLPARFSLDRQSIGWEVPKIGWRIGRGFRWRWALWVVEYFIWVTVLLALWNAYHFLNMRVPV